MPESERMGRKEERKKGRKGRKAVKEDKEHSVCKFMANRRNQCGQKKKKEVQKKEQELGLQMNIKCTRQE